MQNGMGTNVQVVQDLLAYHKSVYMADNIVVEY